MKRQRNKKMSTDSDSDDSDSDFNDDDKIENNESNSISSNELKDLKKDTIDFIRNGPKKRRRNVSSYHNFPEKRRMVMEVQEKLDAKIITEDMVYESNLVFDDKVWMIERLQVLDKMDCGTLDFLKLRHEIFMRFHELQEQTQDDIDIENQIIQLGSDTTNLKLKILRSNFSPDVKHIIYRRYNKLMQLSPDTEEFHKLKEWLHCVMALPTEIIPLFVSNEPTNVMKTVNALNDSMNKNIFGMRSVKERVVGIVLSTLCSVDEQGHHRCIAMVGPSGVGKTLFGMSIAEALGLPFAKISLSGMKDPAILYGHDYTYIGAGPGLVTRSLQRMGYLNGVIYLDEIDKCGDDIQKVLLQFLDSSQNSRFNDHFMPEIPINLSKIMWIISANTIDAMPAWMIQRMPIIPLEDFSDDDKAKLAADYLIPKILRSLQINVTDFQISDDVIKHIVLKSNRATGVRTLENDIQIIFQKLNVLRYQHLTGDKTVKMSYRLPRFKLPYTLTINDINVLLK